MSIELTRQSDQLLRALIERTTDTIALVTLDCAITYVGPSSERVTGYHTDEMVGRNGFEFVHPEDLEHTRQQLTGILGQPGSIATVEFRFRHKNESWRWMEGTLTNLLDDPVVGAVVCNYRDITERKQIEERLRRSEERYRALFEEASDGIFVTDLQGRYVEVNPTGCAISGYTREELLTRSVKDLVPEGDRATVHAGVERLRAGETTRTQLRMKRKDGSLLPVELSAKQLSTGHLLEIARDISAYTQIEARAGELAAIFEAITDGVVVCDASGEIRYTNAAYRSLMGLEEDADPSVLLLDNRLKWQVLRNLEGRPLPKEQVPMLRVVRGERLSGAQSMDLICRTRKGADIILNVSGAPIRDAAGQIIGGVIVLRDVTRRRRLEQQLQFSELKLRALVESNIIGVMVVDGTGRIYEVNDRLVQMLGYSKDELLSGAIRWQQLTPPEYQEALAQVSKIFLSTGAFLPYEKEYLRKDGSRVPVLVAGAIIDQERDIGLAVILDISDRKEVERRKQEFLSMVSHELRTPLTAILGLIELALLHIELHPGFPSPEVEDLVGKVETALRRAVGQVVIEARLVEELLDVSRLEMQKFEMSLQRENLVTIVQETVANQQQAARSRDIELVLPPYEEVPVLVDAGRIGQVLTNYLANALKYAPVSQVVLVRLDVEGTTARVSVCDRGPGLTLGQQQHIWELFYQTAAPGQQGSDGGLGLGLAIAKTIVEQHHGQVGVESAPGLGSTFWFTVPLADKLC